MTRNVSFRDAGLRSPLLRGLNRVGRVLGAAGLRPLLDPDDIVVRAVKAAGSNALGSDSYREPLEVFVSAIESEADLTTFGRLAVRGMLTSQLVTRIRLRDWTDRHPEAAREERASGDFGGLRIEQVENGEWRGQRQDAAATPLSGGWDRWERGHRELS